MRAAEKWTKPNRAAPISLSFCSHLLIANWVNSVDHIPCHFLGYRTWCAPYNPCVHTAKWRDAHNFIPTTEIGHFYHIIAFRWNIHRRRLHGDNRPKVSYLHICSISISLIFSFASCANSPFEHLANVNLFIISFHLETNPILDTTHTICIKRKNEALNESAKYGMVAAKHKKTMRMHDKMFASHWAKFEIIQFHFLFSLSRSLSFKYAK